MGKRRPTPDMGALLSGDSPDESTSESPARPLTKEEKKKARESERIKKRAPRRATYDLPPGMKERITQIAKEQGTTASQIAAFLLHQGIESLDAGDIDLESYKQPSPSLRWDYNIIIDD